MLFLVQPSPFIKITIQANFSQITQIRLILFILLLLRDELNMT